MTPQGQAEDLLRYALDSDIVTYFLKGSKTIINKISNEESDGNQIIIPPIVFYEIKRWLLSINSTKKLALFETMCSKAGIGKIDRKILETASVIFMNLQKKGITVGDNDILIAAYCIHNDLTLVTNNEQHFKNIENV